MVHQKEAEVIEEIEGLISELSNIDPETLAHDNLPEHLNFKEAVPLIKEYLDWFETLYERDLSIFPIKELERIRGSFKTALCLINDIKNFKIDDDSKPVEVFSKIIADIQSTRQPIISQILLPYAVTGMIELDIDSIHNKNYEALDKFESKYQELGILLEQTKIESDDILKTIRDSSAYAGVTENAEAFYKRSNKHFWSSVRWLIATCLSVGLTAGVAIYFLNSATTLSAVQNTAQKTNIPQSVPEAIQYIFAKLVIFSTLTFMIVLCSKNYKSHKHNQTLYDHRATTLDTFQAFYKGTKDEHVQDAILLQAAYAAFGNRQTGFESIQEKDSPPPMQIVDVLNKTVRTAGSVSKDAGHA